MARVTRGAEGARDAAGWSLEQNQKMQGTRPPGHVPLPLHDNPHTYTPLMLKRKCSEAGGQEFIQTVSFQS